MTPTRGGVALAVGLAAVVVAVVAGSAGASGPLERVVGGTGRHRRLDPRVVVVGRGDRRVGRLADTDAARSAVTAALVVGGLGLLGVFAATP